MNEESLKTARLKCETQRGVRWGLGGGMLVDTGHSRLHRNSVTNPTELRYYLQRGTREYWRSMRSNGITEIGGTDNLRKKGRESRDETYTSLMVQGGKSMGIKRSALYFFLGRAGLGGRDGSGGLGHQK